MSEKNFQVIRSIAVQLGISAPISNEDIYDWVFLRKIERSLNRLLETACADAKRVKELEVKVANAAESINEANEFISMIPLHSEDGHVLHYVERAQSWLNKDI